MPGTPGLCRPARGYTCVQWGVLVSGGIMVVGFTYLFGLDNAAIC